MSLEESSEEFPEYEEEEEGEELPYSEMVYETLGQHPETYQHEYQKYWRSIYGVEPSLPERARFFREAELRRRGGPEAIRQERLQRFTQQMASRQVPREVAASRTIAGAYARYRCQHPCENLTSQERRRLNPSQRIRLRVKDKRGMIHCVCYDIIKLYAHLIYTYGPEILNWRDPTYGTVISYRPAQRIQRIWQQLNPCGRSNLSLMTAQPSQSNQVSLPANIYDQLTHQENVPYLILRISNASGDYRYVVVTTFHGTTPNGPVLQLPPNLMASLQLAPGSKVLVETCLNLRKVERIRLQPLSPQWNSIPDRDIDQIKEALTQTLENSFVVQIGETITIPYAGNSLNLLIVDLFSGGRRILAGITKFTSVEVEFSPYSAEGRVYW